MNILYKFEKVNKVHFPKQHMFCVEVYGKWACWGHYNLFFEAFDTANPVNQYDIFILLSCFEYTWWDVQVKDWQLTLALLGTPGVWGDVPPQSSEV